jgi:hypothetical protein
MGGEPAKSNRKWLLAGAGAAGLLLLGCCCVGGVAGWFFYSRGAAAEKSMVGVWEADYEGMIRPGQSDEERGQIAMRHHGRYLEINSNGTMRARQMGDKIAMTYEVVQAEGNVIKVKAVETVGRGKGERYKLEITMVDYNHLQLRWSYYDRPDPFTEELWFKRISRAPADAFPPLP